MSLKLRIDENGFIVVEGLDLSTIPGVVKEEELLPIITQLNTQSELLNGLIPKVTNLEATALQKSNVAIKTTNRIAHTGNTIETTLLNANINNTLFNGNSMFDFYCLFSLSNTSNNKVIKLKLNDVIIFQTTTINSRFFQIQKRLANRGLNNQITTALGINGNFGSSGLLGNDVATYTIDMLSALNFTITVQLTTASDIIALESALVEVF